MSDSDLEYGEYARLLEKELAKAWAAFNGLTARYDDAMKRIQDMQAELEHLRAELARKA